MRIFISLFLICVFGVVSRAQPAEYKMSGQEYIERYKEEAIKEMLVHGIPASITLAQGMLESGNGNSALAVYANNHFGIKCHKEWSGSTFYQDDDAANECFRKYATVGDSYNDHSMFLKTRARYTFLFDLKTTDYKGWAYGLKKAGYATDPNYPERLIKLIEENRLFIYDTNQEIPKKEPHAKHRKTIIASQPLLYTNGLKYTIAKEGETYASIAKRYEIYEEDLLAFNDLKEESAPLPGEKIFLEHKKHKGEVDTHVVQKGETMHSISQRYGIRLHSLYRKNRMRKKQQAIPGMVLYLKNKKPKS